MACYGVSFVMRCAIRYHLYNLKNVKNTHGGVNFSKVAGFSLQLKYTLFHGCFSRFLNRKKRYQIAQRITNMLPTLSICDKV